MDYYTPEQRREYMRIYRARRIADARERLGGVCVQCGSSDHLQFDHIDPGSKVKPLSALTHASRADFERELVKCQLLCEDCHKIKTRADLGQQDGRRHGSISNYRRGCRCEPCRDANRAYHRARRAGQRELSPGFESQALL